MKATMTITISMTGGEQAYFTIEFFKSDFLAVVDAVSDVTLKSVQTNPLWSIV